MDKFYISFTNRVKNSGNYPYDIEMGSFDNFEIAETYVLEYINVIIKYEDFQDVSNFRPILITNDNALIYKYKYVFNYSEFKLFCNLYDSYEKLGMEQKAVASVGLPGQYGIRTFNYFEKLIAGEGKNAYQYTVKESFYNEENGSQYSAEIEDGWKLQNSYFLNNEIKKRYNL